MNPNTINELLVRLDAIGNKLGQQSQQLYQVFLNQAHVEIIKGIIWASLMGVFSFLCAVIGNYYVVLYKRSEREYEKQDYVMGAFVSFAAAAMFFVFMILKIDGNILDLWLNPQYWAFKELMSIIKK